MADEILTKRRLNRILLARQMLLTREAAPVPPVIGRLIGMQAQQPRPPFVGLWTRLARFDRNDLLGLLESREVVRVTSLRGTLHLMTTDDYLAFRQTLQPMLSAGMKSVLRDRAKGLDIPGLVARARTVLSTGPRTFTEVRDVLLSAYPDGDERAMGYAVRTHLPLVAAPDGSTWGYLADPGFVDAAAWLGRAPDDQERAEELVLRYLAAFGPATPADAQAWSGLAGLKTVFETLRPRLQTFRDERERELFDLPEAPRPSADAPAPARFLPGFDNAILAHADRSRIIADEYRSVVTTKNLQVLPTILVDGFVAGVWKSVRTKKTAALTVSPFVGLSRVAKKQLSDEGERLLQFMEPGTDGGQVVFDETR